MEKGDATDKNTVIEMAGTDMMVVSNQEMVTLPLPNLRALNANLKAGYHYVLDAPTSGFVRKGEDNLTYINKDQFYCLSLEYIHEDPSAIPDKPVTSIVMVQFREPKSTQEALSAWSFWHARQPTLNIRIIDVDLTGSLGLLANPNEVSLNAIAVTWNPSKSPAVFSVAVRCLSTDFSSQKGVKGIPLHIQIDTYENGQNESLTDRAYCQIKTFSDKGAERKAREEEKRFQRMSPSDIHLFTQVTQPKSFFQRSADLVTEAILYTQPKSFHFDVTTETPTPATVASNPEELPIQEPKTPSNSYVPPYLMLQKAPVMSHKMAYYPSTNGNLMHKTKGSRILIYARQENESVYTPLHITPPTVQGLIRAVSDKYQIESVDIRFVFRQTLKGITVKMDDDMIKFYSNGDIFLMKVLATEDISTNQIIYDVVFAETEYNKGSDKPGDEEQE